MTPDRTPGAAAPLAVEPPFQTPRQAAGFAVLLAALLGLPVVLGTTGLVTQEQAYAAVPEAWGAFSYIHQQIFEETGDIDLLLISTSHLYQGIDGVFLQQALTRHLGRPATVVSLSTNWRSEALHYQLLRDMLSRRRVHMVLTSSLSSRSDETLPHLQSHRWVLYGADDADLDGLPWPYRLTFHARTVLGLPRHLVSLLRPNRTDPARWAATFGTLQVERGIRPQPFRRFTATPPALDAASVTFPPGSSGVVVTGDRPSSFQTHYLRKFFAVARERAVPIVLLHVPLWFERNETAVLERLDWSREVGEPVTLIGVPPTRLFAGLAPDDVDALFYNDNSWPNHHFNRNGSEFFTRAITPALLAAYDQFAPR